MNVATEEAMNKASEEAMETIKVTEVTVVLVAIKVMEALRDSEDRVATEDMEASIEDLEVLEATEATEGVWELTVTGSTSWTPPRGTGTSPSTREVTRGSTYWDLSDLVSSLLYCNTLTIL